MNLLIVDDDKLNRDVLTRVLTREGYAVVSATGGSQVLSKLQEHVCDLVLLDIDMPDMNGFEALKALRGLYSMTDLPVIMVTGNSQSEDVVAALKLQANDYVTKPLDFPVVLARISTQLALKQAKAALRESEERYALAMRGANDGLWDWNLKTNQVYYSPRWKSMLGYEEDEVGTSPDEWLQRLHPEDRSRLMKAIESCQYRTASHLEDEHRMQHKDGSFRWMLSRGAAVHDASGAAQRMAGSQTDITERTVYDPLTGLPNRILFMEQLGLSMRQARRRPDRVFGVVSIGLDRFRTVNDSLGHTTGDQLLAAIARRLQANLAPGDTIARLGGIEFMILLDEVSDVNDATRAADRIHQSLMKPFLLGGQEVFTTASIGIVIATQEYQAADELIRDALTAMHHARTLGGARHAIFDTAMHRRVADRLKMETDLRRALERQELVVHYQPIVSLDVVRIVGFEALVRWQHPVRGLVPPIQFIPLAEETGLIAPIGEWVLREACQQLRQWQQKFPSDPPLIMSVNLSSKQLTQLDLVQKTSRVLEETGIDPESLKLEITESMIMDAEAASAVLTQLRTLNVRISIDDFGTGYSSLSYLHRLPVNNLKVDKSFTSRMSLDTEAFKIVQTVIALAHNLGLSVIAEGVETAEQLAQLQALGCEFGQGYYFSKPVEATAAAALIQADREKARAAVDSLP